MEDPLSQQRAAANTQVKSLDRHPPCQDEIAHQLSRVTMALLVALATPSNWSAPAEKMAGSGCRQKTIVWECRLEGRCQG